MSPAEMAWRGQQLARMSLDWAQYRRGMRAPNPAFCEVHPYPIADATVGRAVSSFQIFDLRFEIGPQLDWHRDYCYGKVVAARFAPLLNIRDTSVVGDIKYIWELSRHQWLSALAYTSDNEVTQKYVVATLESWIDENPVLTGVNWTSSLELGLRLISWALIYPKVRERIADERTLHQRFADAVYWHLRYIGQHFSRFSSANNHLVGEAAGLYIGAACFPWWEECARWRRRAKDILEREILQQVGADGVNCEQAMSYHLFTLELFLVSCLVGRHLGDAFSQSYLSRIRSMLEYLDAVATARGDLPWFGDSDDARGFLLSLEESSLSVVMDLGGLLLEEPHFLRYCERPSIASQVLLSDRVSCWSQVKAGKTTAQLPAMFPDGGKAVLRDDARILQAVMDFGEHGYTSIAAHGHADALSFVLAIGDSYVLIDPGTYAYHSHPEWRTYFRSTAAHNTVRVDGVDQSMIGGRFLWKHQAQSKLISRDDNNDYATVVAEHDGYCRLSDPVVHRRTLKLDKRGGQVQVTDQIVCNGSHLVEIFFHLHEDCVLVEQDTQRVRFSFGTSVIQFTSDGTEFRFDLLHGSANPIGGWRSREFNCKQPIHTVRLSGNVQSTTTITTSIDIQH